MYIDEFNRTLYIYNVLIYRDNVLLTYNIRHIHYIGEIQPDKAYQSLNYL